MFIWKYTITAGLIYSWQLCVLSLGFDLRLNLLDPCNPDTFLFISGQVERTHESPFDEH